MIKSMREDQLLMYMGSQRPVHNEINSVRFVCVSATRDTVTRVTVVRTFTMLIPLIIGRNALF
jgi:hypothetical protein